MPYPFYRPRRLRKSALLRKMVRETVLRTDDLVLPLFVVHGRGVREPISSMPGQARLSIAELLRECKDAASMGIPAVLLFGLPREKDPRGSEAYAEDGIIQQAVRAVKETIPDLLVITDVCLCEYTSHGHCGIVEDGRVRNDPTVDLIARTAVSHAEAGADMVAPSGSRSTRPATRRRRSWRIRRSTPRPSTGLSARPPAPRRSSATGAPTRWIRPMGSRPCARWRWTWTKGPTS